MEHKLVTATGSGPLDVLRLLPLHHFLKAQGPFPTLILVCSPTSRSHQLPCLSKTLPPRNSLRRLSLLTQGQATKIIWVSAVVFLSWNRCDKNPTVSRMPLLPHLYWFALSLVDSTNLFISWFGKKSTKGGIQKQADLAAS